MASKTGELRSTLKESVEEVKKGNMTAETGRSIAWMACKFIALMKLEIEYAKARGEKPKVKDLED